ncbi:MAG: hypothetical protein O2985_12800 [Proteobacteria bacterium]|nr:hypothetical protein [Pseudomonadota bacterium]
MGKLDLKHKSDGESDAQLKMTGSRADVLQGMALMAEQMWAFVGLMTFVGVVLCLELLVV